MKLFDKFLVAAMPFVPKFIVGKISSRYIAGKDMDAAVETIRQLNQRKIKATVDLLGENAEHKNEATETKQEYLRLLRRLKDERLDASISVKLTAFGLRLDYDFCFENVTEVVRLADELGNFVRIDMEDATCTDDTIDIYLKLRKEFENVGTVFQSYLRRTIDDVDHIFSRVKLPNFRLVKGIYNESRKIAFKDREIIQRNFSYLLEKMLTKGAFVGIATHDEQMVWEGLRLINQLNLSEENFEFQMLLGVDEQLRDILVRQGFPMRIYLPYGKQWYEYSVRRLKENPSIAGYVFKNIFN
ncbi:MAG: proline dehydrogenase [Calditrichaeota bacterium]|nr:proline dehydrogenase [Calditrichota bacterium]